MCLRCHVEIEEMHAKRLLYCVDCHGGDDTAIDKDKAHIAPSMPMPLNPTILPVDYPDLAYLRFLNPSNLRVVRQTCGKSSDGWTGSCHEEKTERVLKSMMATTAGHLTGGAYLNGILPSRTPIWGNMPVVDTDGDVPTERGAVESLEQIPAEDHSFKFDTFQRHYSDVPRKICARCHLWSRGKAVRGVPGQDGNYRSEGCAACHVPYANNGLSLSADGMVPKDEVGHPRKHTITRQIDTHQCAHCHTRGARIGLSFQGLAQLPPATPTEPNRPGLTAKKIYGAYHVQDPLVNPPDIHHERGMHCIDCHVQNEIMGDGNIYGHMDQATEIECEDCHGTPSEYGDLVTVRGSKLDHVRIENGTYILRSKVTGKDHVVAQAKEFTDPNHTTYNAMAAFAMNGDHLKATGGLECYTCHSAWQNNCYGCHFERDLRTSALDYFKGEKTLGTTKTDKKYFLNFKNFHMGWNSEGKVAPYTVGCQVLATVTDTNGSKVLDQEMPRTAEGHSGLGMNAVNPHTTRRTPRGCIECHHNDVALGIGSENFTLARKHAFVAHRGPQPGMKILERGKDGALTEVGFVPLASPRALAMEMNQVKGNCEFVYVANGSSGLCTIDVRVPDQPTVRSVVKTTDARDMALIAGRLFLADGAGGVRVFDVAVPSRPSLIATLPMTEARAVHWAGDYLYVAAGAVGLFVVDVEQPHPPRIIATVDLNGMSMDPNDASDVMTFSQYGERSFMGFDSSAYVADGASGVRVLNIRYPTTPLIVGTIPTTDARGLFTGAMYDPGDSTQRSLEREYLYVADGRGGLRIFDVSTPTMAKAASTSLAGWNVTDVFVTHAFEPPVNRLYAFAAVENKGLHVLDVGETTKPKVVATHSAINAASVCVERIRLDRFVDEQGFRVKDSSHDGARPFTSSEMRRIRKAKIPR